MRVARTKTPRRLSKRLTVIENNDEARTPRVDLAQRFTTRPLRFLEADAHFDEALAAADRAIELSPDDGFGHTVRDAITAADRATAFQPDSVRHIVRSLRLRVLGRFNAALAATDRAIELQPNDAFAHGARGETLLQLGRFDEALAAADRALELRPKHVWPHVDRGKAQLPAVPGRPDQAGPRCLFASSQTQSYLDRKPAAGTRTRRHDDRWKPGDCRERSRQRAGIRRQAAAAVTPRRSDRWQRSRPGRGGATHVVDGNTSASKPLSAMNSCSAARNEFMIASADRKAGSVKSPRPCAVRQKPLTRGSTRRHRNREMTPEAGRDHGIRTRSQLDEKRVSRQRQKT